jgi:FixJ family two-component response regulator
VPITDKTIFVVDDDETILNVLARLIGSQGYAVRTFGTPRACLAALTEDIPGCIVSDLQMPEMDGGQLVKELRRLGYAVPVVIVTAAVPPSIQIDQARRAGAFRILAKPPSRAELFQAISGALARSVADAHEKELSADRIGRHLLEYRQLLDHEEARLSALANMLEGSKRAALDARVRSLEEERTRLDETLREYLHAEQTPKNAPV